MSRRKGSFVIRKELFWEIEKTYDFGLGQRGGDFENYCDPLRDQNGFRIQQKDESCISE